MCKDCNKSTKNYDRSMMATAFIFSEESYCCRAQVGSALSSTDGRPLSTGYNGTVPGHDNNCEKPCPECDGRGYHTDPDNKELGITCKRCDGGGKITNEYTLHAEQNLLNYCSAKGIATEGQILYVTMSPCKQCAKQIAAARLSEVVYHKEYDDTSGIDFLKSVGIKVRQYKLKKLTIGE